MAKQEKDKGFIRTPASENQIPNRTNHLLVIGIDQYQQVGKLANAVRDAKALVKVLTEKYRFEAERITELYDTQASRRSMMRTLRSYAQTASPEDNLLIYFSGHGHYDDFLKEGYWIPCDAEYKEADTYITYTFLKQIIKATKAHHALIIADSCYSGAALVRKKDFKADRFERDPSRWLLASGRNEVVPDGIAGEHSPFADSLLDLLSRYADKGIKAGTLVDKLTLSVTYNSKQTPIGRAMYDVGDRGGEFVFYPRAVEVKIKRDQQDPFERAEALNTLEAWENFIQENPRHRKRRHAYRMINALLEGAEQATIPTTEPLKPKAETAAIIQPPKDKPWIPKLIKIDGDTFMMGKDGTNKGAETQIESFYLAQTALTVAEYRKYCELSNAEFPTDKPSWGWQEDHPMIYVSWHDAQAYCKWLSEETKQSWRLPTETEWEFAARGGNKSKGFEYAGSNKIHEVAWYYQNSDGQTQPVAQLKGNELGLYDMSGNVWEWCEDLYDKKGSLRVLRGGSWSSAPEFCRPSVRSWGDPEDRNAHIGFRLALSL